MIVFNTVDYKLKECHKESVAAVKLWLVMQYVDLYSLFKGQKISKVKGNKEEMDSDALWCLCCYTEAKQEKSKRVF